MNQNNLYICRAVNEKAALHLFNFVKNLKMTKNMTKLEATAKVSGFRGKYTDDELSAKLGITRPTLYARLLKHNWKLGEMQLIIKLA